MSKCTDCKNSVFKEKIGEWKCLEHGVVLYNHSKYKNCEYFEPRDKKSKRKTNK